MTQKLTPHTFKGSGIQAALKPVNPLLIRDLILAIDEPTPPTMKVDQPDGTQRDEPNPLDPAHVKAMDKYQERTTEAMLEAYIAFGVVYTLRKEDHEQVQAIRDLFIKRTGKDYADTDLQIFIRLVAMATSQDITEFIAAMQGRSMPTDPKSESGSAVGASNTTDATSSNTQQPAAESLTP